MSPAIFTLTNTSGTTTTVATSANPAVFAQSITFTATVAAASGTPTGTVQFYVDGAAFGTPLSLSNDTAVTHTSALAVGLHPITATYSGNSYFNVSSGGLSGGQLVNDAPITGLSAINSSPTRLTEITIFTATITTGSNVSYTWAFGDGQSTGGVQVTHRYTQTGTYTATVTALNSAGSISTTTLVTIEPVKLYLPLVLRF